MAGEFLGCGAEIAFAKLSARKIIPMCGFGG